MQIDSWRAFAEKNPIKLWEHTPGYDPTIDQDEPTLTPYLLEGQGNGCVIVLPGGGYVMKAMHEAEVIAKAMNAQGFSAFVLDYRVSPYRYPLPQMDASRAVRFVRCHAARYGVRPDRIAVLGFSAGGHLTACTGVFWDEGDPNSAAPVERFSSRPDAMLPCYPVVDLVGSYAHEGCAQVLLGDRAGDIELREQLSPARHVTERTCPAFLWHTAEDDVVPCQNSEVLFRALCEKGVPAALHIFPRGHHGLGLALDWPQVRRWVDLAGDFLRDLWQ